MAASTITTTRISTIGVRRSCVLVDFVFIMMRCWDVLLFLFVVVVVVVIVVEELCVSFLDQTSWM